MNPDEMDAVHAGSTADLLTVAQAAAALGLSAPAVYTQISHGRIATMRVDGQHRISPREVAHYRATYLERSGWDTRRASGGTPSQDATYPRRSRARRRAVGATLYLADVETRLGGRPDPATVTAVLDAVRPDPDWSVHALTLPGRVETVEIRHHPSGRTFILRRRQGRSLWRLEGGVERSGG